MHELARFLSNKQEILSPILHFATNKKFMKLRGKMSRAVEMSGINRSTLRFARGSLLRQMPRGADGSDFADRLEQGGNVKVSKK